MKAVYRILLLMCFWGNPTMAQQKAKTISLGGHQNIVLIYIPAGSYLMGSSISSDEISRLYGCKPEDYQDEFPQHNVVVSGFWMGKFEVTRAQFARFVAETHYRTSGETAGWSYFFNGKVWEKQPGIYWFNPGFAQQYNHPAVCISWYDAIAFGRWLSKKSGLNCTLPTEEQWEYAARAGSKAVYWWGNDPDGGTGYANAADSSLKKQYPDKKAFNWNDGYVCTAPVGSFKPNRFGLYDLTGNVWEWCLDVYDEHAYSHQKLTSPLPDKHTLRGGCWLNDPGGSRLSDRNGWPSSADSYGGYGFRIVVSKK